MLAHITSWVDHSGVELIRATSDWLASLVGLMTQRLDSIGQLRIGLLYTSRVLRMY
jgi:hypothetical protein